MPALNWSIVLVLLITSSCTDGFVYKKRITGSYYLLSVDTEDYVGIRYKTKSGDFIGRIPPVVIEYGVSDSFIVAKTMRNDKISFSIIDRRKDSDYAEEREFLVANSIGESDFEKNWKDRLGITFQRAN